MASKIKKSQLQPPTSRSNNLTQAELYVATCEKMMGHYITVKNYASQLPWISSLSHRDIEALVRNNYYAIYGFFLNKFYIGGEVFMTLSDGRPFMREHWVLRFGDELAKRMFKNLDTVVQLTDNEIALFLPYTLTQKIGKRFLFNLMVKIKFLLKLIFSNEQTRACMNGRTR
jgi:hypothetical protein